MRVRDVALGAALGVLVVAGHALLTAPKAAADFCAPGYAPLGERGCVAGKGPLVVYLHGRYDASTAALELDRQARLARLAIAGGFSVLALRGRKGQCSAPDLAEHFCWPSNERNADDAALYVDEMRRAIDEASARAGADRRFLLGFSSGGYFATIVATRALLPFDAVAIVGAGPVEPTRARGPKPPLLLVTADDDFSCESMMQLGAELTRESWPFEMTARDGGHELTDEDVGGALAFFTRAVREPWPLAPPMTTRRPKPRFHPDGGLIDQKESGP